MKKRFKTCFPEIILGFGFNDNSTKYTYHRIIVRRKGIIKREYQQYRFARLLYGDDKLSIYKDFWEVPNPGLQSIEDKYLKYYTGIFRLK